MSYKCDYCDKTFQTPQALASHITYQHKRVKPKIPTIPTPPSIYEDENILALRKKLEELRLQSAIEEYQTKPTITQLSERVAKLEEKTRDLDAIKQKVDNINDILIKISDSHAKLSKDFEKIISTFVWFANEICSTFNLEPAEKYIFLEEVAKRLGRTLPPLK
jgi:DNA repair exonuclease SbcCD ATPase subunit